MIGIDAISTVLPSRLVSVADLPERAELGEPARDVLDELGIETVAEAARPAVELAIEAARGTLDRAGLDGGDVDAIVYVEGRAPERLMTSEATRLQAGIAAGRAVTFAVGQLGCVSINAALLTGRALLQGNPAWGTILVAHGSKPPGPRRYRHPVTVNGDGAIAFLLTRWSRPAILDLALETDGAYWDLFGVDYRDRPQPDWVEECSSLRTYSFKLAVESRNRFRELVAQAGDVQHHVMQNLSLAAFSFYEEALGVEIARACKANVRRYGHLGSMDVILNLATGAQTGEFSPGDRVLVLNNSPVAAWSTMVVEL